MQDGAGHLWHCFRSRSNHHVMDCEAAASHSH